MKPSTPERPKRPKTKSMKFNEELGYVPPKLLNFPTTPNPRHNIPVLPTLTFKPVVSHDYETVFRKKVSEPTITIDPTVISPLNIPRSHVASPARHANELLMSDRQHTRTEFFKRPTDVSYLLESQKYGKEKNLNEYFSKTITRSTNLLSPQRQASLLVKTMQGFREKTKNIKTNELTDEFLSKYEQQQNKDTLPGSINKLKEFVSCETDRETGETARRKEATTKCSTTRTRSPLKIVDPVAAIYGGNDFFEIKDNEIKDGLKKVRDKVVVQHRSQNKNLTVPSGRKDVIVLSEWLNQMLEKIYKEGQVKAEQAFENVQLIYTACLQELIRQVKIQCAERGQLFEKIWQAYIDLFDRVIKENSKATREMENHYLDEMEQMRKIYNLRIDRTNAELEEVKQKRDEFSSLLETKKEELRFLKKKTEKLNVELKSQKNHADDLDKEITFLKAENTEMRKLILEAGRPIVNRFAEIQKQLDDQYGSNRRAMYNDQLAEILLNPMGEKTLLDNISLMDKPAAINQEVFGGNNPTEEDEDDDSSDMSGVNMDEVVFKHIAVDTKELEAELRKDVEIQYENETAEKEVQWEEEDLQYLQYLQEKAQVAKESEVPEVPSQNVAETVRTETEQQEEQEEEKEENEQDQEEEDQEEREEEEEEENQEGEQGEEDEEEEKEEEEEEEEVRRKLRAQATLEEGALEKTHVYYQTEEQIQKIEMYDVLGSVEKRLYSKLNLESDKYIKVKLAQLLINLLRGQLGLGAGEYEILKEMIIEKEGKSPCATEAEVRGRKLSLDIQEIDKEGLLQVLEVIRTQMTHKVDDQVISGLDPHTNEIFDSLMYMLRKTSLIPQEVELEDRIESPNETTLKGPEDVSGGLTINNLNDFIMVPEESAKQLVENMTQEEKLNVLEEAKKRLEGEVDAENLNGLDTELIQTVRALVENANELSNEDYQELLKRALSTLNNSIAQVTALKVRNGEQGVDIQELSDIKERYERQMTELQKEVRDYRNRVGYTEKQYDRLNTKYLKLKSSFEENKKLKLQKLSSLIQNVNKIRTAYRGPRASFSYMNPTALFPDEEPVKMPVSYVEYDNRTIVESKVESKTDSVDSNNGGERTESVDLAEQFVDNIVTLIKEGPSKAEIDEEESWSDHDEVRESENRIRADATSLGSLQGSIQDIKLLSNNRSRAKKLSTIGKPFMPLLPHHTNKMLRTLSVNADSASTLLAKVKTSKKIAPKASLPKLTILKFISQIYLDRLKISGALRQAPLYIVTYDYFINKYGLKKVAETKCQQMFESINLYLDNRRISRFRDFLGLGEHYDSDELELYFSTIKLLDPLGNGTIIVSNILDKTLIFGEYAELAATALFEKKIDPQALKVLQSKIGQLKSADKSKHMIEFEDIFDQFLDIQRNLQDKVKRFVKDVFQAADLDSDEIIVFNEFNILYKHLEKERYNEEEVKNLFFAEADLILPDESNERVVSFNRFAKICLERGLFSEEKQFKFARVSDSSDDIQNVQDLTDNLKQKMNEIRLRFIKSETYDIHLKGIMTKLYNSVRNPLKPKHVVWLTYRLLDEESKHQLLHYQIKKMLPKELLAINKFMENYEEWAI